MTNWEGWLREGAFSLRGSRAEMRVVKHTCCPSDRRPSAAMQAIRVFPFRRPNQKFKASVQFSWSIVFDALQPHGLQHTRLPWPSPTPKACSNSCPSSQWCHPIISSSVIPYSSCLQSFPESGSFVMSQLFTSGSQSIGASASASVLPTNIQDWFPLGFTCLISLRSKGLTRVFSNTTVQKHQVFLYSKCKSLDSLFGKQKAYTSIKKDYLEIFFHSHFISILIAS